MVEKKSQSVSKNRKIFTCAEIEELCKGQNKNSRSESKSVFSTCLQSLCSFALFVENGVRLAAQLSLLAKIKVSRFFFLLETSSSENIAHMDPAVIDFASKTHVTRYVKVELMMLKNTRTAQTPPLCRYDQRIVRLNIFKDNPEQPQRDQLDNQQNKVLPPQVPNLTINSWDAKVFDRIQNYHRSLVMPQFDQFKGEQVAKV